MKIINKKSEKSLINLFIDNLKKDYLRKKKQNKRFSFVLTGGKSPRKLYKKLAKVNIDWNNIDLSKHNLLDEINITITNLSSLIDFRSYVTNHIVFSKHFHKCLDDTYQTFGIDLIKNTKMIILKDLLKKYYY